VTDGQTDRRTAYVERRECVVYSDVVGHASRRDSTQLGDVQQVHQPTRQRSE